MFLLGETVGKYQILANLGSGGFGTVFLARDTWIDKKVAIKVPHRQTGDADDLLQEPRLLAALDHPNIVGILTAERTDGTFFIVMEYVKGESLEAVLDREKSLDVPRALNYAVQILKGVEHAHDAQILHRDLRPANVLISESGVLEGGRLRHLAPARALARDDGDRQPAVHGAGGVPGPRRARLGHLLGGRDGLPDADRRPALLQPEPGADRAARGPGPLHAAEAAQQPDPARGLRHRDEGAPARGRASATSAPRSCSTTSPRPPRSTTTPRRWRTSGAACAPARSPSAASAGTAGSRCTPAARPAPSAARSSRTRGYRHPPLALPAVAPAALRAAPCGSGGARSGREVGRRRAPLAASPGIVVETAGWCEDEAQGHARGSELPGRHERPGSCLDTRQASRAGGPGVK